MLGEYVKEYISKLTTVGIMHRKGIELKRRDYDELQEFWLYSTKELEELIKASKERDTFKARVDELEEENLKANIMLVANEATFEMIDKREKQLKQDALLGKALNLAIQKGKTFAFCNFEYKGLMRLDYSDKERLLDWYQQLEKEETSGK